MRRKTAKAYNPEQLCGGGEALPVLQAQTESDPENAQQTAHREDGQHTEVLKCFVPRFILNIHLNLFSTHSTNCNPLIAAFSFGFQTCKTNQ